jgi:hypothetical protein
VRANLGGNRQVRVFCIDCQKLRPCLDWGSHRCVECTKAGDQ